MKSHSKAKRFLQELASTRPDRLHAFASKWGVNASGRELELMKCELKHFWALGNVEQGRKERETQLISWVSTSRNPVVWNSKTETIELNPSCLSIMLASHCSAVKDKMTRCENKRCARLFFKIRSDQKYCCQECAEPAKREAKLRWWHERNQK